MKAGAVLETEERIDMTKTEFKQAAGKAGVNPNIYGLVINKNLPARGCKQVYGGKVVGIEWYNEWITESQYSPMWGKKIDETFEGKVPYVILKKDKYTYAVETWVIRGYLGEVLNAQILAMLKAQAQEKREKNKSSLKRKG